MTDSPQHICYQLGEWIVHPHRNLLTSGAKERLLSPQIMALLLEFLRHPHVTLSRDQLLDWVWKRDNASYELLTRAVTELRKSLGDSSKDPAYIETVSKQGYRLICDVVPLNTPPSLNTIAPRSMLSKPVGSILFGLIVFGLMVNFNSRQGTAPDEPIRIPVTFSTDMVGTPAISRNGELLAYVVISDDFQRQELLIQTMGETSVTKIPMDNEQVWSPTFSPDGHSVAYIAYIDNRCELKILSLISRQRTSLTYCEGILTPTLDWSENGELIAFSSWNDGAMRNSIAIYHLESGTRRWVSIPQDEEDNYFNPKFSQDSQRLAIKNISSAADRNSLVIQDITTSNPSITVYENHSVISSFDWAKDDQVLLYSVSSRDRQGIWQLKIDSGAAEFLYPSAIATLNYSQASDRLIFLEHKSVVNLYQRVDKAQHQNTNQLTKALATDRAPQYSPDNQRLAFLSSRTGYVELWIKDLQTGREEAFTQFQKGYVNSYAWAADGKSLTLIHADHQGARFYRLTLEQKRIAAISDLGNYKAMTASTSQADLLFWNEKDNGVWLVKAGTPDNSNELFAANAIRLQEYKGQLFISEPPPIPFSRFDLDSKRRYEFFSPPSWPMAWSWTVGANRLYVFNEFLAAEPGIYSAEFNQFFELETGLRSEVLIPRTLSAISDSSLAIGESQISYTIPNKFEANITILEGFSNQIH